MNQKMSLPNATTVLVLGICSLVFGCFFIGLPLGIIGITLSSRGMKMYKENPALYDGYGSLNHLLDFMCYDFRWCGYVNVRLVLIHRI